MFPAEKVLRGTVVHFAGGHGFIEEDMTHDWYKFWPAAFRAPSLLGFGNRIKDERPKKGDRMVFILRDGESKRLNGRPNVHRCALEAAWDTMHSDVKRMNKIRERSA